MYNYCLSLRILFWGCSAQVAVHTPANSAQAIVTTRVVTAEGLRVEHSPGRTLLLSTR